MPHLFKISLQKGSLFFPYCEHICNLKYTCWLFWSQNGLKLFRRNHIILEYWRMYNITFAEMISNAEFGHVFSATFLTQIREQMSGPDLHVFTLKFLALKKPGFSPIKYFSNILMTFVYLYSMQLFSSDPQIFSKKFWIDFFLHKNFKKTGLKSCS